MDLDRIAPTGQITRIDVDVIAAIVHRDVFRTNTDAGDRSTKEVQGQWKAGWLIVKLNDN